MGDYIVLQKHSEVIDVSTWKYDEDFAVYPEGAREKNLFQSPSTPPYKFIKPNYKYLFKKSVHRHPVQFWSEIFAFRFGEVLGVKVPPAFVAFNSKTGEYGALIEWFYSSPKERYIAGGDLMIRIDKSFDRDKGADHCLQYILRLGYVLNRAEQLRLMSDWNIEWAKILTFDALIGNTDRHQENWGIITQMVTPDPKYKLIRRLLRRSSSLYWNCKLSPAFDNGTSLMYEIFDENLKNFERSDRRIKYIKRGRHQMKINPDDAKRASHGELIKYLCSYDKRTKKIVQSILERAKDVEKVANYLVGFDIGIPFTEMRSAVLQKLIRDRVEYFKKELFL